MSDEESVEPPDALEEIAKGYEPALSGEQGPKARMSAILEITNNEIQSAMNRMMFTGPTGDMITGVNGNFLLPDLQGSGSGRRGGKGDQGDEGDIGVPGEDGGDGAQTSCSGTCGAYYS